MNAAAGPVATLETALAHASRLLATDPALAGEQATEIIKAVGDHPMALLVLGVSRRARGDIDGALGILQPLATAQPNSAMAQLELGIALGRARQGDEAVAALRRAVKLKPDLPQAWLALGDHLMAMDDAEGADAAYANHVRYSTRDPQLLAAANALHEQRIPEAEALLRAHLKRSPTDVVAIRMLAELAVRLGRNEDAEHLLARCLELAPGFHAARQNYALALHRANKPARALAEVETLLAVEPDNAGYRNLKAVVLCRIGDYEPALELYAAILEDYPRHARIWMSYGHALKTAGHQDRAIEAYRRSLQLNPGFGEVWWSLANLKTVRFSAEDLAIMRGQLDKPGMETEHRQHLEFAIGKALEDASEFEASFRHYQRGNDLRREVLQYRAGDTTKRVARIVRGYTREFFAQRAGSGSDAPDPIFIVGLPRAGSTLIEQILSSHSAVEGTMELPEITSITRELRGQGDAGQTMPYHDVVESLGADALRRLGERYLEHTRIQRKTEAPFFIDKMPNNFLHIGLIQLMLPKAKIVDARRHPLACCFSGYKQHFARGQSFTYSLEDIGRYYADYVELMAHFDDALPGRVHRVFYEDMVDDTETQVRRLLEYCGLPFEDGCLRFFENKRAVRTASSEQVRKPIYREGVDHWRNYDPWLGPLKQALGPVLDSYPAVPEFPLAR
ncbi:tetratricopeptide repeat-containing sulfotransferase family protein [Pseudoxanthomonas sacheonensis]|uniref:Tetratricopeptide (TPR) repeat protein n=1 Tax=Pseudoxanthomonas sacheonensis TaxID=443615 RepID=A0ABU1RWK8_9GAMM|nr:sulfotransferase [Pseudoxanthomonas sacheonensis]MDR6842700.1 tetratricopeptide (TPR) repeat protein [Pseudoxanthomonas sacheonensis]